MASLCQSRECQTVLRLPVNNKVVNKSILEYMTVVIRDGDRYFMVQNEQGLLQHLYGFAQYGCDMPSEFEKAFYDDYGVKIRLHSISVILMSHTENGGCMYTAVKLSIRPPAYERFLQV
ncbi:MAG: hypothetical protein ACLTSO_02080 [Coprococcus sp.]